MTNRIALLLLLLATAATSLDPTLDKYCGITWTDASTNCRTPCPSGDVDCAEGEECHMLTGCYEALNGGLTDTLTDEGGGKKGNPTGPPNSGGKRPRPDKNNTNNDGGKGKNPINQPSKPQEILPDFLGLDTLLSSSRIDDDSSHGVIFDVETASDSTVLRITHVEFYSSHSSSNGGDGAPDGNESDESSALDGVAIVIDYQVYMKEGTWHDAESEREYQLVSSGNMTLEQVDASNNDIINNNNGSSSHEESINELGYTRHRIPLTTKIKLNGNGTRYSLYVGLSERVMLYQRPSANFGNTTSSTALTTESSDDSQDYIPLLQTNDMTIYFGAATMIYPLSKANHPVFYRQPRGFVGRIWYERDACVPSVIDWDECQRLKRPLSMEAMESVIEMGTVYYGGLDNDNSGDNAPSVSSVPASSAMPTGDGNRVYLVITFGEAPLGSLMDASAQTSFEQVLFDFYTSQDELSENEVDLFSVKMWYQQFVIKERDNRQMRSSSSGHSPTSGLSYYGETPKSGSGSSIAQYQATVIISIMHSSLPEVITRDLLENTLNDNMSSFLKSLKLTPSLTPYIENTGYIASVVTIDELTSPPTSSPTYAPTISITEPIVVREPTPPYIIAAILIASIYTCSMIFSTCYIKRARNEMEYDRDIKVLFQNTTMEDNIRSEEALLDKKDGKSTSKKGDWFEFPCKCKEIDGS
ncbi:hypothetical protein HJC23_008897 [Cyclotella cryptica]|uniref:Uncharacterized protein n=1 Tax=Cyclotella cryptica TaxID=29204 RepID=A0ABD3NV21_9STRA|eukprot:CCRYP_020222-RA/>CCRYP_020222-RA protein AED:0.07 eAED:0.07 QI:0/-1/0/1/-1/1/1/0/698